MYKSMFRPEVIRRIELCFFQSCAKLPSLPRASEIHHVVIPVEHSTSVYINLVRCVYHGFTFSLVLGVSPIAIVVCLIRSEEHTSELQSHLNLLCRLLV